ncbi:hypothetical protein ACSBR2_017076 [Camellia fascicularis]
MASSTVVQRGVDMFKDKSVEKIILVGASGVGKTWTAKQLSKHAIKEGLFEIALWVFCNREYHGTTLSQSIARQLSLLPVVDEWEAEDSNKGEEEDENHEDLQTMIAKSLDKKKPLSVEESLSLFRDRVGRRVYEDPVIKDLAEKFIKETKYFPATIMLMAKAFSYFVQCDSGTQMLESALKEACESDSKNYNLAWLLHNGYDMLPKSVLIYCCRHGSHFFRDRGSIYYSELIAYWILERYLGHVDCMEKAYEKGHFVFMELVDCQLLKKPDSGNVVMDSDRAIVNLDDFDRCGFGGEPPVLAWLIYLRTVRGQPVLAWLICLRMTMDSLKIFKNLMVLDVSGATSLTKFINKTFQHTSKLQMFNFSHTSINRMPKLKDLGQLTHLSLRAIKCKEFHEQSQKLPSGLKILDTSQTPLEKLPFEINAHHLFIKHCLWLQKLPCIEALKDLKVLDLSGTSSLVEIEDQFFSHLSFLQILNLSKTGIKTLPSVSKLKTYMSCLQNLDLFDCTKLKALPPLETLSNLKELNLCGVSSLKKTGAGFF